MKELGWETDAEYGVSLEKAVDRDNFMSADRALEFGIVDKILARRELSASDKK